MNNPFMYDDELWTKSDFRALIRFCLFSGNCNATENVANKEAFCGFIFLIILSCFIF